VLVSLRKRAADAYPVCWATESTDAIAGLSHRERCAVLSHAAAIRLATLETVARLHPVASCIEVQECFRCGLETKISQLCPYLYSSADFANRSEYRPKGHWAAHRP
jgi:hypothetical protein